MGTSLVVQGLRLCVSTAGLIPGWGTKITHAAGRTKGEQKERTVLLAANSSSISCISLEKAGSGHSGGCFEMGKVVIAHLHFPGELIWTVKKAERQRFDTFELWCWRRLLSVPWTARSSNQSILKEISPDAEGETPVLWPPDAKN